MDALKIAVSCGNIQPSLLVSQLPKVCVEERSMKWQG